MKTVVTQFLEQAQKHPDNPAVLDIYGTYTYERMNNRSAYLAEQILEAIGGKGQRGRIALFLPRTKEFVVALFAVLRAGCAAVPIDGEYPRERVHTILEDVGCALCITAAAKAEDVGGTPKLILEEVFPEGMDEPEGDTSLDLSDPDAEGYILYTSGSTGKPKGVVHRQAMLNNAPEVLGSVVKFTEKSRSLNIAGFSFIAGTFDTMPLLTTGGSVYIANETERKNMDMIWALFDRCRITGMYIPPQMFTVMRKLHGPLPLEYVAMVGEKFVNKDNITDPGVVEFFGASETGTAILIHHLGEGGPLSLGKPADNVYAYLLDEDGNRIEKPGEIGELCVTTPWLALGYNRLPEETAKRFTENPFRPGERMYHTGDQMAWAEDGSLVFHGRNDRMIKLRGYRIELGEIDQVVRKKGGIDEVANVDVAVHGAELICCYYTGTETSPAELKEFASAWLPEYMIPEYFIHLDKMPRNDRGKFDYPTLKAMEIKTGEAEYEAPRNGTERQLCEAMEDVLETEENSVGIHDNFFEIGGDSIKAMMVMSRAGLEGLSARMIFQYKTPAKIAENLSAMKADDMRAYEAEARTMQLPAHKGQILMIDDQFEAVYSCMYNLTGFYRIGVKLDAEKLARAVDAAVRQHPGLCSTFDFDEDGYIFLSVRPDFPGKTEVEDISPEEVDHLLQTVQQPFLLFRRPLFRSKVYRSGENLWLFLDMHHTVSDGTSIGVLLNDISKAYWGEEMSQDFFYSYLRKEYEARGTEAFEKAWGYFRDLLGDRDWCRIPTPDFDTTEPNCASEYLRDLITTDQMAEAEKRTGYSRNVMAIAAVMLALREYCGRDDICVDYINSNRIEKYLQGTVGLVYKTLPVAVELNRYPDAQRLLKEVNRQVIDSFVNSICDYRAETATLDEDCIAVNYIADLGSAKALEGFEAEELEVGDPDETMGGHADLYFEEDDGMITLQLDYLKKAYREDKMQEFIRLCAKYLRQVTGIPEAGSGEP